MCGNILNMQTIDVTPEKTRKRGGFSEPSKAYVARKKRKIRTMTSSVLDLKKIRAWAQVGCTLEEIAGLLGVTGSWLSQQKDTDYDLEDALVMGRENFRQSLRSTQARLALSGHPGMLIWLGKQFLGQSDKQETKQETTVNVVLQRAMQELRELDADTIVEMKRLLEKREAPLIDNEAPDAIVVD